jgi:hypothetical protein
LKRVSYLAFPGPLEFDLDRSEPHQQSDRS